MTKLPLRYFEERKASRSKIQLGGGHLVDGFLEGLKKFSSRCAKEKKRIHGRTCVRAHSRACMGKEQATMAGWVAAVVCSTYTYTYAHTVSQPPYTYVYQAIIS
jgi:hypothetical protein